MGFRDRLLYAQRLTVLASLKMLRAAVQSIPGLLMLGGALALVYGAWLVYQPAAWIIGGVLAVATGWRLAQ